MQWHQQRRRERRQRGALLCTLVLLCAAGGLPRLAAAQATMGMAAPKATAKVPAASGRAPAVAGLPATTAPALATATSVTSTAAATDAGVAATAAGAAGDRAKPANVLRIGGLVPLSGGGKVNTGKAIKAAVEMAVRDVAPKRLPGVKVETYFEDTQCGDVPALNAARKLVRNNNVGERHGLMKAGWWNLCSWGHSFSEAAGMLQPAACWPCGRSKLNRGPPGRSASGPLRHSASPTSDHIPWPQML